MKTASFLWQKEEEEERNTRRPMFHLLIKSSATLAHSVSVRTVRVYGLWDWIKNDDDVYHIQFPSSHTRISLSNFHSHCLSYKNYDLSFLLGMWNISIRSAADSNRLTLMVRVCVLFLFLFIFFCKTSKNNLNNEIFLSDRRMKNKVNLRLWPLTLSSPHFLLNSYNVMKSFSSLETKKIIFMKISICLSRFYLSFAVRKFVNKN